MVQLSFKDITTVPAANDMLDIVLNRTQRKTPTVIRRGFQIQRIRSFYMRKVRYTAEGFVEKFDDILTGFPNINDLHPFQRDLMDTLYEKNHYKVSLASISKAKTFVEKIARDYVRLLKFAGSLYQCKELKRAALGRMATLVKKLKDPLAYLEQVRQHLGRLPAIDPNTRTLVICGYPNVGKSSFLRCITKADVDVQPYAFTTKALYVGHFDYKYLRFQAIDTPGILDRPTEEMTNIEMQSVYAIAHLRSCILYFMDLSEQCGFSVEDQVKLFHSIKPLFVGKPVMIVMNKSDIIKTEDLSPERQELIKNMTEMPGVEVMETSSYLEDGVMDVRNLACEKLLASRIEQKLKGTARVNNVLNKIHVSKPQPRDDVSRPAFIPDAAGNHKKYDADDPNRRILARDVEEENGGAGVYNIDLKDSYLLEEEEWKKDVMPEVLDGKNIYDFLDPEISAKLQALEEEEERLEKEGFYDSDHEEEEQINTKEGQDIVQKAHWIRNKQKTMISEARQRKALNNKALLPRSKLTKSYSDMEKHMHRVGHDTDVLRSKRDRSSGYGELKGQDILRASLAMDGKRESQPLRKSDRLQSGVVDGAMRSKAERITKLQRRERNRLAKVGESDHRVPDMFPKHLHSGKRGIGKTQRR